LNATHRRRATGFVESLRLWLSINLESLWLNYQFCSEFDFVVLNTSQYRSGCEGRRGLAFFAMPIYAANPHSGEIKMTSDTSVISLLGLTT
jgi:hypothetical protein